MNKDLIVLIGGRVIQILIMLVSIRILTTLLSPEEVGNYYLAISILASIPKEKICANIRGNHEDAIENFPKGKFSTKRGKEALRFTKNNLTKHSFLFI